jgi:hypothetical protein
MMMQERGRKMKKLTIYTITMVFAVLFSVAYAYDGGKTMINGITDFSGRTVDTLSDLNPGAMDNAFVEGSSAGGIREPGAVLYNGITIFNGKGAATRSDLDAAYTVLFPPDKMRAAVVESSNAGGIREEEPGSVLLNGITDFTGKWYDSR